MFILGRVKNAIFSLKQDNQLLMQQKSCQKCPSPTLKFVPPAVTTRSSSMSSYKPHLLFTYQTSGTLTVKLAALTLSKSRFRKAPFFGFLGTLLREQRAASVLSKGFVNLLPGGE